MESAQISNAGVADRVKLITIGRLTKLPHIVEVRFVALESSFFVLAGNGKSDWVQNALRAGRVKLRTREWVIEAAARRASKSEESKTVEAFSSKYGGRVVRDWYSKPAACLRLTPEKSPIQRGAIKGEGEATTSYREWLSQRSDYYTGIAEAFDSASEEYDFTISHNYINTWIRKRSIRELLDLAKPGDSPPRSRLRYGRRGNRNLRTRFEDYCHRHRGKDD